jgi:tetratricopeptide (TPR) repeat protein
MFSATHHVVLALMLAAGSAPTEAETKRADELIAQGNDLRRRGDNQGALELYQQAHEIAATPRTAAQLGLAEQAAGRWADADGHLTMALRETRDPWVNKNRKILAESLGNVRLRVGRLEIVGDPEGAEVLVNGRVVGTLPLKMPTAVNAGTNDVEVRAQGYASEKRSVHAPAQQVQGVVFRLMRNPPPSVGAEPAALDGPVRLEARNEPDLEKKEGSKVWLWAAIGVGAIAAAVVGVVLVSGEDTFPNPTEEVSW